MWIRNQLCAAVMVAGSVGLTAHVAAQCRTIDFENFSAGTIVSTQYSGVTFANVFTGGGSPGTCNAPAIVVPNGGTASPTRALSMRAPVGCGPGEFNGDLMLRITFAQDQNRVLFTLGAQLSSVTTIRVRAFNASGFQVGATQDVQVAAGVHRLVSVGTASGPSNIRRIDIDPTVGGGLDWAVIDDLQFGSVDPPLVQLTGPSYNSCQCGNASIPIQGSTCPAPGGSFAFERHEYRAVNAPPDADWTFVTSFSSPFCSGGTLHSWNVSNVPEGTYYYRVVVGNECGRTESAVTAFNVRKSFGTLTMSSPAINEPVCGRVEIVGTVSGGGCGTCYTVSYAPLGSSTFLPVDPENLTYCGGVTNCRYAIWDTDALGLSSGSYELRVKAENNCGYIHTLSRVVTVDQSQCACAGDLNEDGLVNVLDLLLLLNNWGTCP